jgi:hypothetical protein
LIFKKQKNSGNRHTVEKQKRLLFNGWHSFIHLNSWQKITKRQFRSSGNFFNPHRPTSDFTLNVISKASSSIGCANNKEILHFPLCRFLHELFFFSLERRLNQCSWLKRFSKYKTDFSCQTSIIIGFLCEWKCLMFQRSLAESKQSQWSLSLCCICVWEKEDFFMVSLLDVYITCVGAPRLHTFPTVEYHGAW